MRAANGTEAIHVRYVCEHEHQPAEHGVLEFDIAFDQWRTRHPDPRLQRMAECFVTTYFERKKSQAEPLAVQETAV